MNPRITRITRIVAIAACASACGGLGGTSTVERREPLTFDLLPAVELRLVLPTAHVSSADRYVTTAHGALRRLGEWLAPYPHPRLTIIDRGWPPASDRREPGVVVVHTPWLAPARGGTLEAALVYGIAAEFWGDAPASGPEAPLIHGLTLYSTARALDDQYAGGHVYEQRLFGGIVPYVFLGVPVQGFDAWLARDDRRADVTRVARALSTLERYLGWGTLQQVLAAYALRRRAGPATAEDFYAILTEVSGRDLTWFVDDAFRSPKAFDFGIAAFDSRPIDGRNPPYLTTVVARRYGEASFAGTSRTREPAFASSGPLAVVVTFADGHEVREGWDGRDAEVRFEYESRALATAATVDPDRVVRLDSHPANNRRTLGEARRGAVAWAARWGIWLQDALLSYAFFF